MWSLMHFFVVCQFQYCDRANSCENIDVEEDWDLKISLSDMVFFRCYYDRVRNVGGIYGDNQQKIVIDCSGRGRLTTRTSPIIVHTRSYCGLYHIFGLIVFWLLELYFSRFFSSNPTIPKQTTTFDKQIPANIKFYYW